MRERLTRWEIESLLQHHCQEEAGEQSESLWRWSVGGGGLGGGGEVKEMK